MTREKKLFFFPTYSQSIFFVDENFSNKKKNTSHSACCPFVVIIGKTEGKRR